ncbi:hypothetical protein [Rathayibacter sp. VKM Ac-2630]|uniref:hypothetical protein n=1 Tax=Rathayibacter sp. VKM Ac-2630 TaxID=1938617 RepID=UPI00098263BC|nr:hypothetical protein [Rathayibacter sp. VKM Ac-2630]OOB91203.1 hypothetical protein B0T42_07340 [Rathayibacter sp. VKM Ac-2630]
MTDRAFMQVDDGWVEVDAITAIVPVKWYPNDVTYDRAAHPGQLIGSEVHFHGGKITTAEKPALLMARMAEAAKIHHEQETT